MRVSRWCYQNGQLKVIGLEGGNLGHLGSSGIKNPTIQQKSSTY